MKRLCKIFFPDTCLLCANIVNEKGICGPCWGKIKFLGAHACDRCYQQFPYDMGPGSLCTKCSAKTHYIDKVRSVMVYDKTTKPLIFALKNAHNVVVARILSRMMVQQLEDQYDYVIPVPLHFYRFVYRGYNQSEILAHELSKQISAHYVTDLLARTRFTTSQGRFDKKGRPQNVLGAFECSAKYDLAGKSILLIDDVYTTGSTAEECAKVLKKHGAARVFVCTVAMVMM